MGKKKYLEKIEELFKKSPVINYSSISRIVKDKRKKSQYAKQLLRNLVLKGKIKRLTNGFYSSHDNPELAVFCFAPAYLGLQDSLSFHNLWEQETIPIIITSRKVRIGIRKIFGMNVLVRRINRKYFFGFDYSQSGEFYFPYSDIEKTFIDMIYFKEKISKETLENIKKKINKNKFKLYIKKYPKRFQKKILINLKEKKEKN